MKAICGYWALDGERVAPHTLAAMRTAGMHNDTPHLEAWRSGEGTITFGSAWWSPQTDLQAPSCIARHAETGCVALVDARLDNTAELRNALNLPAPDAAPDSTTDHAAQLVLHAWLRWGEDCVERIDGDFAFAIHDPRRNLIYLARDRMGERPLYVHHVPGKLLVFGSTSHAVLAHPNVPKDINQARIADYLLESVGGGLEGVDFTSTFHLAIERHPPRHATVVTPGYFRQRRYWTLEPGKAGPLPKSDAEWSEALTAAMERAVAQRLIGPQRVGSMLSGGLDSTSLAIIAGDQLRANGKSPLPTFSAIDSSRADCLETRAVHIAAQMPIFKPTLIDIANLGDVRAELENFLDEFDEPFDAGMALIDAQYAMAARVGVGAVIDGGNGDSLFLPGNTIRRQIRAGHWLGAWRNVKGLTRFGGQPWDYLRGPLRSALAPTWLIALMAPNKADSGNKRIIEAAGINPELAKRVQLNQRLNRLRSQRSSAPLRDTAQESAEALLHTFPVVGTERYLRVAARQGIVRLTPFTERSLLELCMHLPDNQRLREGWTKFVLRHAMRERMPASLRLRSDKQHLGWRLTHSRWVDRNAKLQERLREASPWLSSYLLPAAMDLATTELATAPQSPSRQILHIAQLARWFLRGTQP